MKAVLRGIKRAGSPASLRDITKLGFGGPNYISLASQVIQELLALGLVTGDETTGYSLTVAGEAALTA